MDTDAVSGLSLLTDNPQLIELGLFAILVIWMLLISRTTQAISQRRWQAELAAKDSEIQALDSRLQAKDQEIALLKENAEAKLAAKQTQIESREQELQGWRERLEIESAMYRDIIAAKDEKFDLQQTMLKSLEERYAKEIQQFQQRYDAMVNQRAETISHSGEA